MVKIEGILILLIIAILTMGVKVKLHSTEKKVLSSKKELDFYNTTIDEVSHTKLLDTIYTTYGVRENGILRMKNIKYHSDSIDSMIAKEGKYVNNILYLHKDIIMLNEGYTYTTQNLYYNKISKILNITSDFKATNAINTFWGKTLVYYTQSKEMFAKETKGIFYTIK